MVKRTIFSVVFIAVAFLVAVQANATYAGTSTLAVGNSFTFSIKDFQFTDKINGTNYAPSYTSPVGKSYALNITSITNSPNPDISNLTQKVGYSMKFNGSTYSGSSWEDEWLVLFGVTLLLTVLAYGFASPHYADFSAPSTTTDVINASDINNLPFFVSGNQTLYGQLKGQYQSVATATTTVDQSGITNAVSAGLTSNGTATDTYVFDFEFNGKKTATTTTGDWSFSVQTSFKVTMDLARGIITDFYWSIGLSQTLGSASEQLNLLFHIVEGTISTPGFEIILFAGVFVSVSAIVVIRRKMVQ